MRQPDQDLETFLQSANPPEKLRRSLQAGRRLLPQNGSLNFAQWVDVAEQILEAVHWPGAHPLQSRRFSGSGKMVAVARQRGRTGLRWPQNRLL